MKNIAKSILWLLAVAVAVFPTRNLIAQAPEESDSVQATEETNHTYGTTAYSEAPDLADSAVVGPLKPTVVEGKASYATGGVALRNRGAGNISISGLVG